jgi:hypothetical protein
MATKHASPDSQPSNTDSPDPGLVQQLSEIPRRPGWLDRVEEIVGANAHPDRIYEDDDRNLHIIFYDHGFRHPDNERI